MAGATLEFDNQVVLEAIRQAVEVMNSPETMHRDMGEYLLRAHFLRFAAQRAPDGTPWTPLSPRYQRRKPKNRDKILILDGYLMNTLRYQTDPEGLEVGSNRPYAALMHFGGTVQRQARQASVYFKTDKQGNVGNRFVSKKKSNFAQDVKVGAHKATYPARPILGTSEEDNQRLVAIAMEHMQRALGG